jgi:PAS domain S-box-containing protein
MMFDKNDQAAPFDATVYHTLFKVSSQGICLHEIVYDAAGTAVDYAILDVNQAFEQVTGLTREAAIGKLASKLYGTGEPPFLDTYAAVADTGEPATFEVFYPPMDKHFSILTVCPQKGQFATIFSDVTKYKQTEETLTRIVNEVQFLSDIARNITDSVIVTDTDYKITYVNKAAEELFGYSSYEIVGQSPDILNAEPTSERIQQDVYTAMEAGNSYVGVALNRRRDGSIFDCEFNVSPIKDTHGATIGSMGVQRDVTERKRGEDTLRESEEKYRNLFETMAQGVVYQDATGEIISMNKATERILGLTCDQIQGRSSVDPRWKAVHEDGSDFPGETHPAMVALKTGKPIYNVVMGVYHPSTEQYLWISIDANPQYKPGENKPYQVYTTFSDITEQKYLDEERLKSAKLESTGVLAGGIAHDFNNILTSILGNISLARWTAESGKLDTSLLEEAEKATKRATGLTQQLLTFARGGAPIRKRTDIAPLLMESVGFALHGSNVLARYDISEDLWQANVDEGQINQVISNLVINSLQAMTSGGVITVKAENVRLKPNQVASLGKGSYISVTVTDNGAGIPPDILDKVFDPYFTTKGAGSGLGLASSYSIIQKHGGYIAIESKLKVGTTVTFYLPAMRVAAAKKPVVLTQPRAGGGRILLMDDEASILQLGRKVLEATGYSVEVAADGAEALKAYRRAHKAKKPFDAVILDLTVPGGMGGVETVREILKLDPSARVLVSSGYSNDPVMTDYRQYGFAGVLTKPYNTAEITRALGDVISG